ncbi:MAG: ABC transporter permease [Woeseiaceae bacterium]|nr:ABC transporter permease [Woeseiaceae bacterium]
MFSRIYAVFRARNLEFLRDRGSMAWNIALPVGLVIGLSFVFGGDDRPEYTVGVLQTEAVEPDPAHPFLATRYLQFVDIADERDGRRKVGRHQLDLLVELRDGGRYWVNPDSARGYFAELALLQAAGESLSRQEIGGVAVRYVDWVLPGILGMNMMFSSLFGVGYVVVRYRKNGFLKRLRATPLRAVEFVIAQMLSRLVLTASITTAVFTGVVWALDIPVEGSPLLLFLIAVLGAVSLISLGLVIASRVTSEELAGGLLNMITWPMMLLSGVWFTLEGADAWVRQLAAVFPLTHVLDAARAVMLDGAGLADVLPELIVLLAMTVVFLIGGATLFRWRSA